MSLTLYQVDAFAQQAFAGNPAAVCIREQPRSSTWMQQVAAEMNLSETAFLEPAEDGSYHLRWFTPAVEVDLCGHATLASAHILWETGRLGADETARFQTRSGLLTAERAASGIVLNFPATPAGKIEASDALLEALGIESSEVHHNGFDYLVQVASEADVRAATPDFSRLQAVTERGVILTAEADAPDIDFVSRFFAPAAGIDEDPVTGSAHCTLGPYWAGRLGKTKLHGFQASARGGHVGVEVVGDRVLLTGHALTVMKIELLIA